MRTYLRHLKHSLERPLEVPQPLNEAGKEASAAAHEWRRSPRYKCEGSAQFRVDGSDVHTWGTFTDISVHGCYVEMTATYPVGSVVDLVLEMNGIRAHVSGEVRVSYPCLGMGIAFQEVPEAEQAKLVDMVRSLNPVATSTAAASRPAEVEPHSHLPLITNAGAAVQALATFFENHSTLSKEDLCSHPAKEPGSGRIS